jgi:choline-glycine betaine transporter
MFLLSSLVCFSEFGIVTTGGVTLNCHVQGYVFGYQYLYRVRAALQQLVSTAAFCSTVSYQICSMLHVNVVREADAGDHVWRNIAPQTRLLILQLLQTSDGERVFCTDVQSTCNTVIKLE